MNALDTSFVEPEDIANMVLFLAGEEARMITGTTQVVDAGAVFPWKIPHAQ
jgi:NAD(P)-dependent dehydrogenase (short-subunit alcohol dehydrogenase family)